MKFLCIIFLTFIGIESYAQYGLNIYHDVTLTFMEIHPDARIGGFGEVDVISSPFYSNTGLYRNPALLSKNKKESEASVSYMPYLGNNENDLNFIGINGYFAFSKKNAIGLNYTLFNQGELTLTDENGIYLGKDR
ncbi:MAG: hypothetical protein C0597_06250, partial [Marinilabiliales bacterium]